MIAKHSQRHAGQVSEQLRNLMMKHSDSRVFLNHYLSRRVTVDTQAIVRGTVPQNEIMKAACRMSRWIDPERPRKLTPEQSASVNENPEIQKLLIRQTKLRGKVSRKEEYKEIGKQIRNERQRLRHNLLIEIRKNWDREQAERDIRLQLSGMKFEDRIKTNLSRSTERTPEHNQLIKPFYRCRDQRLKKKLVAGVPRLMPSLLTATLRKAQLHAFRI